MNAVEIEEAVSLLAEQPFEADAFPYAFLEAFGNKATTIKRLKNTSKATTNKSDIGGVLQRGNIHIKVCEKGKVAETLDALRGSSSTASQKAKFTLATDGIELQAEDLEGGETVACDFPDFANHFGFFLELAGISTVRAIKENSFDIKATSRLNKLYIELLKDNPEWASAERRHDLNHFMARLIFCFFAEDTDIFRSDDLFTSTVEQMSARDSSNTHEIIAELFRAMDTAPDLRAEENIKSWADVFPYVNGDLFKILNPALGPAVPRFSKICRSYLIHVGKLDWTKINPDIFGSMIQAVADDEERGALGMHYTSVPNILKVLNPLFLDDLRDKLGEAGDNKRKLLNLRNRIARIRVFDPACGSGNFLVIAYKEMRAIEAKANQRRGESDRRTDIPLTNFRGIELKDFSAEVARLALIIAEYQCDVMYRGQKEALAEFLPLEKANWITCGNALKLDWLSICPPTGTGVKHRAEDLFGTPLDQAEIDFRNEGGETYICGNPPFTGTRKQSDKQKSDLNFVFSELTRKWKNVDYVGAWFLKAAQFNDYCNAPFAFVATNSLCQGQQVPITWALLLSFGLNIRFAVSPFKWSNLASNKAGVTVIIAGLDKSSNSSRAIYYEEERADVDYINPYLTPHRVDIIDSSRRPLFSDSTMEYGVYYSKSARLILKPDEASILIDQGLPKTFIKQFIGSNEFIKGITRYCLWISDERLDEAKKHSEVAERIQDVNEERLATKDKAVNKLATRSHQFREYKGNEERKIFVPIVSSEAREYFPAGLVDDSIVPTNKAFYAPNAPLWMLAVILTRLHLVWIGTICGRLEMRYSYSNTLGWNTFPIPRLTDANKADLALAAEDILLAREAHFPATIADLYDPKKMPDDLRAAHERNDEVLERIYIGRRFKNDTERLEKLFDLYTKMTAKK